MTGSADEHEERRGLYFEEVGKTVDGVVEDILSGAVTSQRRARTQTVEAAWASGYSQNDDLAVEALRYSAHPCAELTQGYLNRWPGRIRIGDAFPFTEFAGAALVADCLTELARRPEYRALRLTEAP